MAFLGLRLKLTGNVDGDRYWDGIDPDGSLAKYNLTPYSVLSPLRSSGDSEWYLPSVDSLYAYYHDYFQTLKEAGVDFVKVDDQADVDHLESGEQGDAGSLRSSMLAEMTKAADECFGPGTTIHCMAGSRTSS